MANRSATLEREHATPEQKPKRGSEHARLDEFVGTWTSEGLTAAGPSGPAEKMAHEHTYEWLPGRFFLLHRWDGLISERESRGIEIIGYDASKRAYAVHFFDSDGWSRIYQGKVHDRTWMLTGNYERCMIVFSDDGNTMTTHWERSSDGANWQPLCDVKATRIK